MDSSFAVWRMAPMSRWANPVCSGRDYVFLNHMARGSTYMGVAGLRREEIVDMQKAQACQFTPGTPACEAIRQHFKPWIEAALAVQLATIPPI
jgi:hypothetical protein